MSWVHDSGYEPAYAHVGHPVAVQIDGSETASSSAATPLEVIGWRSACECGWRGTRFYPRSEWPSATALAPDAVDGWEDRTATFAEWQRHLDRALPDLAVHDLARQLADIEEKLAHACHAARLVGLSWTRISRAAGGHAAVQALRSVEITGSAPAVRRTDQPRGHEAGNVRR
ncbi:hypothetical protein [Pseudonocardia hydrocarbonoxydans]|uniref:hypothetical protein n=1 Tax=Pseudonocardia hydrocarbonoxydans TaxID=76726 RepID=UPI0031D9A864